MIDCVVVWRALCFTRLTICFVFAGVVACFLDNLIQLNQFFIPAYFSSNIVYTTLSYINCLSTVVFLPEQGLLGYSR